MILVERATVWYALRSVASDCKIFNRAIFLRTNAVTHGEAALGDGMEKYRNPVLHGKDCHKKFLADLDNINAHVATYSLTNADREVCAIMKRIMKGGRHHREALRKPVPMKASSAPTAEIDRTIKEAHKKLKQAFNALLGLTKRRTIPAGAKIASQVRQGLTWTTEMAGAFLLLSVLFAVPRFATCPGLGVVQSISRKWLRPALQLSRFR